MVAGRQMSKYIQILANATKEKQGAVIANVCVVGRNLLIQGSEKAL